MLALQGRKNVGQALKCQAHPTFWVQRGRLGATTTAAALSRCSSWWARHMHMEGQRHGSYPGVNRSIL